MSDEKTTSKYEPPKCEICGYPLVEGQPKVIFEEEDKAAVHSVCFTRKTVLDELEKEINLFSYFTRPAEILEAAYRSLLAKGPPRTD